MAGNQPGETVTLAVTEGFKIRERLQEFSGSDPKRPRPDADLRQTGDGQNPAWTETVDHATIEPRIPKQMAHDQVHGAPLR